MVDFNRWSTSHTISSRYPICDRSLSRLSCQLPRESKSHSFIIGISLIPKAQAKHRHNDRVD